MSKYNTLEIELEALSALFISKMLNGETTKEMVRLSQKAFNEIDFVYDKSDKELGGELIYISFHDNDKEILNKEIVMVDGSYYEGSFTFDSDSEYLPPIKKWLEENITN